jgi:hypothetical protein
MSKGRVGAAGFCLVPLVLFILPVEGKEIVVRGRDSAALAAAVAVAGPGDTVRLPAGLYRLTEAVRLKSRLRLSGAGQHKTILRFAGERPTVLMDLTGCEDTEVEGLTLDGCASPKVYQGILASQARRLHLHDLTIRNLAPGSRWGPHGILFTGTNPTRQGGVTDSEVSDCTIENVAPTHPWGAGIRLAWGSARNRIVRNRIHNTGRGGILANDGATDLVIAGNTITASGGEGLGIEVWGGCDRCVIEDNRLDHWLSIGGCDYCAVRRNVISDKSGVVKFCGLEAIGSGCVFTDNLVDDGQQIGLSISGPQPKNYCYFGYNTIRRCLQWGAQLQGEAGGIAYQYFYRCRFEATTRQRGRPLYPGDEGHGFRTNGNVRYLTWEECQFANNAGYGLQLGGRGVDFLSFVRCAIINNGAGAVSGPGAYHGLGDPGAYTALEWVACRVEGQASRALPPAKPFAAPPPEADFRVPGQLGVGQPARFVATRKPGSEALAAVLWDFGDGPPSTAPATTHTYYKPGRYRVTLVVWGACGRAARVEKIVRVAGEAMGPAPASLAARR